VVIVDRHDLSKDELLSRFLQMEERIDELEENLKEKDERIEELETRLRKYENPHTPPSKRRSGTDESPTSQDDEDDDVRTDGGTPGRKDGHDPEWRSTADPDEEIELTCDCCPECGEHFDESVGVSPRLVEEIPDPQPPEITRYNRHYYQYASCGTETVATHPDCPDEGQFGVNVIAQSALSRYDHRLPYRKIADRFEQLHGLELSGASAWHATERAARAGRCEYEQIRQEIQDADVVHIDETGIKRDGEQAWIWTFQTVQHTLYAVRERVEGVMFPQKSSARTSREQLFVMAGRRIRPSAATSSGVGRTFSARLKASPTSRPKANRSTVLSNSCTSLSRPGWRAT
jgi:transposase